MEIVALFVMLLHTSNSKHVMQYALFSRLDKMYKLLVAMPPDTKKKKREEKRERKGDREKENGAAEDKRKKTEPFSI